MKVSIRTATTRLIAAMTAVAVLAGCASSSQNIASSSVSPLLYQNYSCDQLVAESQRVQTRVTELGGRLDQAAQNDKVITGVALVLFWPAAFALGGTKAQEAEYGKLKGENDAIQQAMTMKNCGIPTLSAKAPKEAEKAASATTVAVEPSVVTEAK